MCRERQGDGPAYAMLLGEVAEMMRGLIRSRLRQIGLDVEETEDLVQEVLIGLHTKRHTWDPGLPFLPWLYAIARYKLSDAARRQRRAACRCLAFGQGEWDAVCQAPDAGLGQRASDIERHLATLPRNQHDVVRSLAVEGHTVRATAIALQTSEGAVRMIFHRALRRLAGNATLAPKTRSPEST